MLTKNTTYVAAVLFGLTAIFTNTQSSASDNALDHRVANSISHSFNNRAIIDRLGSSCAAQEQYRQKKVRRVMSPSNTPPAYKNQGSAFFIHSPEFSQRQQEQADRLPNHIPSHVRAFLYNEGGTFVLSKYATAEAIPSRRAHSGGYMTPGLYRSQERRVYLPFMTAAARRGANGLYEPHGPFVANVFHLERILNHETGHAIDDLLGNYLNRNAGRLTNRSDIRAAINSDLAFSRRNNMDIGWRDHYFPRSHGGKHGNGTQLLRREVFAELWSEASGHEFTRLSSYYPETYQIVKGIHEHLESLYERHGTPCIYNKDGSTVSPAFSSNVTSASESPNIG